jgi:hypothetical protein
MTTLIATRGIHPIDEKHEKIYMNYCSTNRDFTKDMCKELPIEYQSVEFVFFGKFNMLPLHVISELFPEFKFEQDDFSHPYVYAIMELKEIVEFYSLPENRKILEQMRKGIEEWDLEKMKERKSTKLTKSEMLRFDARDIPVPCVNTVLEFEKVEQMFTNDNWKTFIMVLQKVIEMWKMNKQIKQSELDELVAKNGIPYQEMGINKNEFLKWIGIDLKEDIDFSFTVYENKLDGTECIREIKLFDYIKYVLQAFTIKMKGTTYDIFFKMMLIFNSKTLEHGIERGIEYMTSLKIPEIFTVMTTEVIPNFDKAMNDIELMEKVLTRYNSVINSGDCEFDDLMDCLIYKQLMSIYSKMSGAKDKFKTHTQLYYELIPPNLLNEKQIGFLREQDITYKLIDGFSCSREQILRGINILMEQFSM